MFGWLFGKKAGCTPPPAPPPPWAALALETRHEVLSAGQVTPEAANCVQCGCCTYNCPMGIDVRAHAWRGLSIRDSHCLTCGECVKRCPRGVLRFERIPGLAPS
ncbi:MAG: 4Fe-4S dicluster domain-containing protein [Planctomycetia bacterium]|nr:4Fe-4S dicluster domain-containing protein [Planctomycetia bacterium]